MRQQNYVREVKDPLMTNYIVNESQPVDRVGPITFSQDDARGIHYPHYDVLVVRMVMAQN